jgi:hypothetical protein
MKSIVTRVAGAAAFTWLLLAAPALAHPPATSFMSVPDAPEAGQLVEFRATTTGVPEHTTPLVHLWDLDGDGQFDDASGETARQSFPAGDHVVRLKSGYPGFTGGHESVAEKTIHVAGAAGANQPPVAAFEKDCSFTGTFVLCAGLLAREQQPHTIDASPSHDPDGQIVNYEWDLDGTGDFERSTGATPTVTHTFERRKGLIDDLKRRVRLRVTDDAGAQAEAELTLSLLEPSCQPSVGKGRLRATGPCIRPRKMQVDGRKIVRWYSERPIKLNGLSIAPKPNNLVVIELPDEPGAPAPKIASGNAIVTAGAPGGQVRLVDGSFAWRLNDGVHLSGFAAGQSARLNGLKITSAAAELADTTSSRLALRVALPNQFGGATSDDPIVLTPGKASASAGKPLKFEVANAAIGPIGLDHLVVTFDGEDLWEIAAGIKLPEPIPYTISGDAGIRDGEFEHAGAAIDFGTPGIGPLGPVFLQRIAFRIEVKPKKSKCVPKIGEELIDQRKILYEITGRHFDVPNFVVDHGIPTFALCGEVGLTAGPEVLGAAAIRLDAGLGLATYDDRPHVLRAFGDVKLVEIPLAKATMEVHTNGYTKMLARVNWGIEDLATINGFLRFEMLAPKFNAEAYVDACLDFVDWCAGARAIVSSQGVAVCLKIDVLFDDWTPGFGYTWGETFPDLYFSGCDIGEYREHIKSGIEDHITVVPASVRARAAGFQQTIDLPAGLPGATIVATGQGAAPKITLIGPKGERITSPDDDRPLVRKPFLVMKDPRANVTQFAIGKPSAGRWRVLVEEGSAPVTSIASANGLDKPEIDAKVVGRGHRRALRYRIKPVAGQKVTFMERGPSAGRRIGVATKAGGRIRFTPAPGSAEKRRIVALVTQDGQERGEYEVARYRAPGQQRPARPRALRVTRRGSTLRLAWKAARPADSQRATVRLSDGRRLMFRTRGSRLVVRGVPRRVRGTVEVRGVLDTGVLGRPAIARVGGKER